MVKTIGVKHNQQELETLKWFKEKTGRNGSNAIKWAVREKAEELGYVPPKK